MLTKLTGQARSRGELEKALQKKNVPDEVAAAVLDRMTDVGLVNDAAFANDWVESRQSRRHLSSRVLRQELMTKGVDRDEIDAALAQVSPEDEYDAALALAEKKVRPMAGLDPAVRRRRLAGALARRGFSSAVTGRVLGEVLDGSGSATSTDDLG